MILRSWCLLSRSLKWVSSWLSGSLLWRFREGPCAKFLCEDNGDTLLVEGGEGLLAIPPKGKGLYLDNAGIAARFLTTVCPLVQTMILVYCYHWQCSHKAAPHWVSRYRVEGQWQQCWLFRNRWVPTSGNHSWRSEGWYHPTRSYCSSQQVSSILLCAPCVAKSVTLELTGSQVISQPYIDMMIATKTFGVDFSKDWLCIYVQLRYDVHSLVELSCYDWFTWLSLHSDQDILSVVNHYKIYHNKRVLLPYPWCVLPWG